jgi:hypothetical protein
MIRSSTFFISWGKRALLGRASAQFKHLSRNMRSSSSSELRVDLRVRTSDFGPYGAAANVIDGAGKMASHPDKISVSIATQFGPLQTVTTSTAGQSSMRHLNSLARRVVQDRV